MVSCDILLLITILPIRNAYSYLLSSGATHFQIISSCALEFSGIISHAGPLNEYNYIHRH